MSVAIFFLGSALVIIGDGLTDDIHTCDVAIVPGNKIERDGRPSKRLQARLDKAIELFRQQSFCHIIVSGGVGVEGFDEAQVMRGYLLEHGIPESGITADSQGTTTFATAHNARVIMRNKGFTTAMVISQYFHITRLRLAVRKFGTDTVFSAHAHYWEWRDIYSIMRETIGYYVYLVRPIPPLPTHPILPP